MVTLVSPVLAMNSDYLEQVILSEMIIVSIHDPPYYGNFLYSVYY